MSETQPTPDLRDPDAIGSWLAERIGHYLRLPAGEIDHDAPLAGYGLDSVYAFALCGDIEDQLGVAVEPTLVWDVDTVHRLAEHLAGLTAEPTAS
jgi:acyl carrier protein